MAATGPPTRLKLLPARELVLAASEGLLSEEEAGAILFHRAKRRLWKLEREGAEKAASDCSSDDLPHD